MSSGSASSTTSVVAPVPPPTSSKLIGPGPAAAVHARTVCDTRPFRNSRRERRRVGLGEARWIAIGKQELQPVAPTRQHFGQRRSAVFHQRPLGRYGRMSLLGVRASRTPAQVRIEPAVRRRNRRPLPIGFSYMGKARLLERLASVVVGGEIGIRHVALHGAGNLRHRRAQQPSLPPHGFEEPGVRARGPRAPAARRHRPPGPRSRRSAGTAGRPRRRTAGRPRRCSRCMS